MEIKKINCYCIANSELGRKFDYAYYWTDATEEEFEELLNNYLSENGIQEDKKFKAGMFTMHIYQNGHYIHTRRDMVMPPK